MKPDAAPATADPAAVPKATRFAPKLLIVGGVSALALLLLVGGLGYWLWPKAAEPPVAKALARKAAVAASAASAPMAVASAALADSAALPASAPRLVRDDGDSPPLPLATKPGATHAHASAHAQAEVPLDRLRRRLGQVLGENGQVWAEGEGELRLHTRNTGVASVAHAPSARNGPDAAPAPAGPAHGTAAHWAYEGRGGPQAWGRLKPEFSQCASGKRQSPIDIRDGIALDLDPLVFDYKPSSFGVIDNGHTVQVNVAPGNAIEVMGRRYELQQFHFHRPSEERINGRQFEMNAHLVHKDASGRMAVVAVLLERGAAQPLLQTVWNHLPLEKHEELAARTPIDLNLLLPTDRRYYTYMGSLTTPPCSEGVLWMVMQQPVPMSAQQIDIFSRLYPMNARPIQQASGRIIKQSN
jgi:carbonic anhydrase